MKTRQQYIAGEISHHEYYSQFVTQSVKLKLLIRIPLKELKSSRDPHFNDIPLKEWDTIGLPEDSRRLIRAVDKGGVSLSDSVCVFKTAARILLEE